MRIQRWQADVAVRQLAQDRRAGSVELALQACQIFEAYALAGNQSHARAGAMVYSRLARAVAGAQPSMAAVLNVSNRWLCAVQEGERMAAAARRIARELRWAQRAAAACAATLVADGATVLTYSFSSTVLAALLKAWNQGRRFRVLCSESRPQLEGRALAARLASRRVPVELYTDAALFSAVAGADLVLAGCDAIQPAGFVNKVGTKALCELARRHRIPFCVVGDSLKFLPLALQHHFRIRSESPAEVWRAPRKNIRVHNVYFETVPLRGCSSVITEGGIWSPRQVRGLLEKTEIAAEFRQSYKRDRNLALGSSLREGGCC